MGFGGKDCKWYIYLGNGKWDSKKEKILFIIGRGWLTGGVTPSKMADHAFEEVGRQLKIVFCIWLGSFHSMRVNVCSIIYFDILKHVSR